MYAILEFSSNNTRVKTVPPIKDEYDLQIEHCQAKTGLLE